ncbi:MAG: hypothetical protein N4A33_09105 [Bacteriovoracaceae bacterium]|jgi:hypothetical protein|nr:hypothetical protein [Bacteriovoracaceae bacterium]
MKKVICSTFIFAFLAASIVGVNHVYQMLLTNHYTINTNKFSLVIGQINHSLNSMKSINKPIIISDELSLKEPVELEKVVETSVKPTNWEGMFNALTLPKTDTIEIAKNNIKEDRISTALSAPEKSSEQDSLNDYEVMDEQALIDLVEVKSVPEASVKKQKFYQDKTIPTIKKKAAVKTDLPKTTISYDSILKNMKNKLSMVPVKKQKQPYRKPTTNKIVPEKKEVNKNSFAQEDEIFSRKENRKNYESTYSLNAYSVNFDKMTTQDIKGFEVRFNDDLDDIYQDMSEGYINLEFLLNTKMMVRRGTILSNSHYPMNFDFVFENGETTIAVPLIDREGFDDFINVNNYRAIGGHVLVELDNKTEDIILESSYEAKIYLDKKFKAVDRASSDFNYILFVGVKPGNAIIKTRTLDNQYISKIIHITEEEFYFEPNLYLEKELDEYSVFEENLLGKKISALSISADKIESFSNEQKVEKLALNRFKQNNNIYFVGTRKYQEYKHLDESIFVGSWNNDYIDLPSEDYMGFVLSRFDEQELSSRCMVQVNITKPAKELVYNGQTDRGGMHVRSLILDKDGSFYDDLSLESSKIFLLGENQGIVNFKINYTDGSVDFIQSYCSNSTYLVEQL